eukprot:EG_transcript_21060
MLVFVYGTLKRGFPNHGLMRRPPAAGQFCGTARTAARFPLVVATPYRIPFLLDLPGQGHQVVGEVWDVMEDMAWQLDAFEGVEAGFYQRKLIDLQDYKCGSFASRMVKVTQAFAYFRSGGRPTVSDVASLAKHPHLAEYTQQHAALYIPHDQRRIGAGPSCMFSATA